MTDTTPEPTETEDPGPGREAARYRTRLREAEAREAALTERLTTYQRREVERLAGERLSTPGDMWLTGPELADLLDDDGDVDPVRVTEAVAAVVEARPGWKRPDPPPSFDGGARATAPRTRTMQELLQGDRRS